MSSPSHSLKKRLESFSHILTGAAIAMKGISKLEHPETIWAGLLLLFIAAGFILIGLLHHRLQRARPLAYLGEALVMGIVGYVFLHEGKTYLPWISFGTSLVFFILACTHFFRLFHPPPAPPAPSSTSEPMHHEEN